MRTADRQPEREQIEEGDGRSASVVEDGALSTLDRATLEDLYMRALETITALEAELGRSRLHHMEEGRNETARP